MHSSCKRDTAIRTAEGFGERALFASYVHLHFGADARLAPRFVDACRAARTRRST